jgi:hypothetical protein
MRQGTRSIRVLTGGLVFAFLLGACSRESTPKPKPAKKSAATLKAVGEREALNAVQVAQQEAAGTLAEKSDATPTVRAAVLRDAMAKVPATQLPETLQQLWQEMTHVLETMASSSAPLPPVLETQGPQAAAALNAALADQGLTGVEF